jgi:hypothetical protein
MGIDVNRRGGSLSPPGKINGTPHPSCRCVNTLPHHADFRTI